MSKTPFGRGFVWAGPTLRVVARHLGALPSAGLFEARGGLERRRSTPSKAASTNANPAGARVEGGRGVYSRDCSVRTGRLRDCWVGVGFPRRCYQNC